MRTVSAKHNLKRMQMKCVADILEEEQERNERDFSFSWSRPVTLYALEALAISNTRRTYENSKCEAQP